MSKSRNNTQNQGGLGHIRIISGLHRGRKLKVLDKEGLRPTTDRIKETLFNWLMLYTRDAKVLDMFAGSGALGFEAYSRGAHCVTMLEKDRDTYQNLITSHKALGEPSSVKIIYGDALELIKHLHSKFDIVFLDPPFRHNILTQTLPLLVEYCLQKGSLIYIEQELENTITVPANFNLLKEGKAGQVSYKLYRYE